METRKIVYAGEEEVVYKYYDGMNFPAYVPGDVKGHLETVKTLSHKDGDSMVASFPKSGTHWMFEIMRMLTTGKLQYYTENALALDYHSTEAHEILTPPRVLATHLYPKHLPKLFLENKSKIVYVYRNPKDTAVSMFNFMKRLNIGGMKDYNGNWNDYINLYWDGYEQYNGWFQHVRTWINFKKDNPEYPILIISYEDMKKDLRSIVQKVAEHLGTTQKKDFLDEVTQKCQFSVMQKQKNEEKTDENLISRDGTNPFYRKGEVGDWKNNFTVAQNERFDSKMQENMDGIDVPIQFTL